MGDLSKYFSRLEFECHCNCGFNTVDAELIRVLEDIRFTTGQPITINSGFRCDEHNAKVGGKQNSQHLLGKAADITVKGYNPKEIYTYLNEKYPEKYGIGDYSTFTHLDVRYYKARW